MTCTFRPAAANSRARFTAKGTRPDDPQIGLAAHTTWFLTSFVTTVAALIVSAGKNLADASLYVPRELHVTGTQGVVE